MFLGLLDPDLSVRGMDPDPDPSIIKHKYYEKPLFLPVLRIRIRDPGLGAF
jgi:hypothetical protein